MPSSRSEERIAILGNKRAVLNSEPMASAMPGTAIHAAKDATSRPHCLFYPHLLRISSLAPAFATPLPRSTPEFTA